MLSVELFSGKVLGQAPKNAANKQIQRLVRNVCTDMPSYQTVKVTKTAEAFMVSFGTNDALLLIDMAKHGGILDQVNWDVNVPLKSWERCTFDKKDRCISLNVASMGLKTMKILPPALQTLFCGCNQLQMLPDPLPPRSLLPAQDINWTDQNEWVASSKLPVVVVLGSGLVIGFKSRVCLFFVAPIFILLEFYWNF